MKWAAVTAIEPAPDGTHLRHPSLLRELVRRTAPRRRSSSTTPTASCSRSWGAGDVHLSARRHRRSRRQPLGHRRARRERQGPPGLQVQSRRQGADDARQGRRQRLDAAICSISRPTSWSRRTATSSSPTATATARTTASSSSRRTASTSRSGARRDRAAARSASRTPSRWIRAGGCSSAIARTTASRSSIRTARTSTSGGSSAGRAGSSSRADDTIYVADSESGPDTGARELTGHQERHPHRQRARRHGHRVHRGHGVDDAGSFRRRRRRRRRAGQRLRRAWCGGRCSNGTSRSRRC